jgi:formylglycine-generating enzyme required for sulfatase activity
MRRTANGWTICGARTFACSVHTRVNAISSQLLTRAIPKGAVSVSVFGRTCSAAALLALLFFAQILKPAPPAAPLVVNDGHGDYVYVSTGTFRMGDNFGDGEARERPVHLVELDAFYIGKYEITNAEWRKFRGDRGYDDPSYWPASRVVPKDQVPYWSDPRNHGGGTPDSDNYPLIGVNWDSATAYCNWLSAKTGKKYRLPTEAEWEKAARGTDQRRYPWGNNIISRMPSLMQSWPRLTGRPSAPIPLSAICTCGCSVSW